MTLIQMAEASQEVSPFTKRDLEPGEKVFHRKVGNNRKFDNFDAGSPKPCSHGVDSFERFHGDKSLKGMARRYGNFQKEWLRHCGKYPDCNVYAVFSPAARS